MLMLEGLLDHVQAHDDVTFTTLQDHAARWREANPLASWVAGERVHAGARD